MAVCGKRTVNRLFQIKVADDGRGTEIENLFNSLPESIVTDSACSAGIYQDRNRLCNADGISKLNLAAFRQTGCNNILSHIAGGIGCAAVNFCGILSREGTAAVRSTAAVGIHNDFSAGKAGISLRAADDETAGRVNEDSGTGIHQRRRNDLFDYEPDHILPDGFRCSIRSVLSRKDNRIHTDGVMGFVIFNRYLCFAIRPEIVDQPQLSHFGKTLCQLMGKGYRKRHQFRCFTAGVAEHHTLISGSVLQFGIFTGLAFKGTVNAKGNVRRLFIDIDDNAAGIAVKTVFCTDIADVADDFSGNAGDIDIGFG